MYAGEWGNTHADYTGERCTPLARTELHMMVAKVIGHKVQACPKEQHMAAKTLHGSGGIPERLGARACVRGIQAHTETAAPTCNVPKPPRSALEEGPPASRALRRHPRAPGLNS